MSARGRILVGILFIAFLTGSAAWGESRLIFPRVCIQEGKFSGIAIANPTTNNASVTLTAYNADGTQYTATGVTNPSTTTITAGSQYTKLATDIYGSQIESSTAKILWVEAVSTVDDLTGFFLYGKGDLAYLDGSDLRVSGTDLVLPFVQSLSGIETQVSIVNPDPSETATLSVDLVAESGAVVRTHSVTLPAHNVLQGDVSSIFPGTWTSVATLRLKSNHPLACIAFISRQSDNSLVVVGGRNASAPVRTLYFPQLAQGGDWYTNLGLLNLTQSAKMVTITAYKADGTIFGAPTVTENPVSRALPAGGSIRTDVKTLFGFSAADLQVGWIKADATEPALTGYVEYGAGTDRALVSAQSEALKNAIFSHQANVSPYYTGLAILNPGSLTANVEVVSLKPPPDNTVAGKTRRVLRRGQREAIIIENWIPGAAGVVNGAIILRSDTPVIVSQLFGTSNFTGLSNVPPQDTPSDYDPGAGIGSLKLTPSLAVVETGKSMKLTPSGATPATWAVNGVTNGNTQNGTITTAGNYTAPSLVPSQHTQTITAATSAGDQTAAASIDVVQRENLVSGLTLLTSVAYFSDLQRFFVAEQKIISSEPSSPGRLNATTNSTQISEVATAGTAQAFQTVNNDTIVKMLPFTDGVGSSHLLLAGYDSGTIHRLTLSSKQLTTIATGLSGPNSLALDPSSGDLYVSEAGADRIIVIEKSEFDTTSGEPAGTPAPNPIRAALTGIPSPKGIAFDPCTGALYVSSGDGTLRQVLGTNVSTVVTGLANAGQVLVLMREDITPCSDAVTVFVANGNVIAQVDPRTPEIAAFLDGIQQARDLAFIDSDSPFARSNEETIAVADGPGGASLSRVLVVRVGRLYRRRPADAQLSGGLEFYPPGESVAFRDRVGDTFPTILSRQRRLRIPDVSSLSVQSVGGDAVVTLNFVGPVTPASQNSATSLTGWIDFDTIPGVGAASHADAYRPLRLGAPVTDFSLDLATGLIHSYAAAPSGAIAAAADVPVKMSFLDNSVSAIIPGSIFDVLKAKVVIAAGNLAEITDIAPESRFAFISPKPRPTPAVLFARSGSSALEWAGEGTIDVMLSPASSETVTVNYAASGGTATGGGVDYKLDTGTLTFAPGEILMRIPFAIANDRVFEGDETLEVTLSAPVGASLGSQNTCTFTILDDDASSTLQFTAASSSGLESVTTVALNVSLGAPMGSTVRVDFAVTGGTATPAGPQGGGGDYSFTPGTLTFAAGETRKSITFTVVNDTTDEPNETIIVTLSNPVGVTLGAVAAHTYTILDDDSAPQVQFQTSASSGSEATANASVSVVLTSAAASTVTVNYAVTGGTATSGGGQVLGDYTFTPGTLTFASGETSKTITFTVVNDTTDEPNETIIVTLSNPVGVTLGAVAAHTYTILDDDSAPQVQFQTSASSGSEATANASVSVVLTSAAASTVTVNYAVTGGTATSGGGQVLGDYTFTPGTLTFASGETSKTITFTVVNDTTDEPNETIIVTLSNPVGVTLGAVAAHTYTILDDDSAPQVQFQTSASSGSEATANASVSVVLTSAAASTVTVNYAVTGGTATSGGGQVLGDYTFTPGTLTFASGETSKTITFTVVNDTTDEPNETIIVTLSNPVGVTLGAVAAHTYTILDDDSAPQVQFQTSASSGSEATANASVSVVLTSAAASTVTVNYAVTGGTATLGGGQVLGDYTFTPGTLTFASGETSKTITFTVVNDTTDEPNETIIVTLSNPVGVTLGAVAAHTYTILDDDGAPQVQFQTSASSGSEATANASVSVVLTSAAASTVTVNYAVTGGTATSGGGQVLGDYTFTPGTLTFASGETSKTITFTVVNDSLDENDETVIITLSGVTGSATLGTQFTHTLAIQDEDAAPTVQFGSASSRGAESITPVSIPVSLSTVSGKTVTVPYTIGGTATGGGTDYTLAAGTLTFAPGSTVQNITFSVVGDTMYEADETVIITLSVPVNASLGSPTTHTYYILNDDSIPTVQFGSRSSSAQESVTNAGILVTLSNASSQTITVEYSALVPNDPAAGGGVDYTLNPGKLTFTPGQSSQSINFTVNNDNIDETDETLDVGLSKAVNATLGTPSGHVYTILDNDPTPTVQFSGTSSSAVEANTAYTLTVTLSNASSSTVTVNYSVTGTATVYDGKGGDYNITPSPLTFTPGQTQKTITITIRDDNVNETPPPTETVIVTLTSTSANAVLGTSLVYTHTITDNDKPDLVLNTPVPTLRSSTVALGGRITFTSTNILNQGNAPCLGYTVGYFLSTDATITMGDYPVGTVQDLQGLSAGFSFQTPVRDFTLPTTGLPVGTYYFGVIADTANAIAESNESNNSWASSTTMTVVAPDLLPVNVSVTPANPIRAGTTATISYTVRNRGTSNSVAGAIGYYVQPEKQSTFGGGTPDLQVDLPAIAAGGSTPVSSQYLIPRIVTPGNYYLFIFVDNRNSSIESSESNNIVRVPIAIN